MRASLLAYIPSALSEFTLILLSMHEVRYLENMGQYGVGAEGKNKGRGGDPDTEFQYVAPSEEWVI